MEGFEKPKLRPADGERNFQEEKNGAEMRVATMFGSIGEEALGRIKENPKTEGFQERNLN